MSVYHELPKHSPYLMQKCPFCEQSQPIYIRGAISSYNGEKFDIQTFPDLGYSFCNCKNIWYTNWENMHQGMYEDGYDFGYKSELVEQLDSSVFNLHVHRFMEYGNGGREFLEIGSVVPYILNTAKYYQFNTTGLDIFDHKDFGHPLIVCNFEKYESDRTWDIIWASHIFEHFEYPLKALERCYSMLNPGGLLYIAMPDPFFIDWKNVYSWAHWHLREHHILWDMDSFIDEAIKAGFEKKYAKRNIIEETHIFGDMHIILRKPK